MRPRDALSRAWPTAAQALVGALAAYAFVLMCGYFAGRGVARHRVEAAWLILVGVGLLATCVPRWLAPRAAVPPAPAPGPAPLGLWIVAMTIFSLTLYWPALTLGFLSDDFVLMGRALRGDFWSPGTTEFLRPVPLAVWAAIAAVPAPTAIAVHALNIVLHGLNAALVATLATRLGFSRETGSGAAILFLCYPAAVEAVAWASGVQDVLLTSLCLVFVLACFARRPRVGVTVAIAALLAAMGTKETAVAAPAMALLFVWARKEPLTWRWQAPAIGAIAALSYALWRTLSPGIPAGHVPATRYAIKEVVSRLFGSLALPFTAAELREYPLLGIGFGLVFLVLAVSALYRWHGERPTRLAAVSLPLWALLSVAPVGIMFYVSPELKGSRYVYLAACGWSLLVAVLLLETASRKWRLAGRACLAVMLAVAVVGVRAHLTDWHRAAQLRDVVLAGAVDALRAHACDATPTAVTGLPESVGGAYVLGNGFLEALAAEQARRSAPGTAVPGTTGCALRWDGSSFQVQ